MIEDFYLKAAAQIANAGEATLRASVEPLLHEIIEKRLLSGAIVGILHRGQRELFTVGSGLSSDALMELGSVSKIFTGLLLAAMMEREMIDFDDPVHHYLPNAFAAKLGPRPVRIRDLALHRAGLPSQASNTGRMKRHIQDPHYNCTAEDLLEELSRYDLQRPEPEEEGREEHHGEAADDGDP